MNSKVYIESYFGGTEEAKRTIAARARTCGVKLSRSNIKHINITRTKHLSTGLVEVDVEFDYKDDHYVIEQHIVGNPNVSAKFTYTVRREHCYEAMA